MCLNAPVAERNVCGKNKVTRNCTKEDKKTTFSGIETHIFQAENQFPKVKLQSGFKRKYFWIN